jgi:small conductance mechanosensitive channel
MKEYFLDLCRQTGDWSVNYSPKILAALLIFIVGIKIAKWASLLISRAAAKSSKGHATSIRFIQDVVYYMLYLVVVIAAFARLGIPTTSFLAVLGTMGLAIGLAFKDSLGNFASGVMIIIFRPIAQGDFITVGGESGTVLAVGIFNTIIVTPDNKKIIIPNSSITTANVYNFSANPTRRVDVTVKISYKDDIKTARAAIDALIKSDERVLSDPAPMVVVSKLADTGVEITARMWCNTVLYWDVFFDMNEKIKEETQKAGLTIPVPALVKISDN